MPRREALATYGATAPRRARNLKLNDFSNPRLPHSDERTRCQFIDRFRVCLTARRVLRQMARLNHFSPFSLPSLVAHMDFRPSRP